MVRVKRYIHVHYLYDTAFYLRLDNKISKLKKMFIKSFNKEGTVFIKQKHSKNNKVLVKEIVKVIGLKSDAYLTVDKRMSDMFFDHDTRTAILKVVAEVTYNNEELTKLP